LTLIASNVKDNYKAGELADILAELKWIVDSYKPLECAAALARMGIICPLVDQIAPKELQLSWIEDQYRLVLIFKKGTDNVLWSLHGRNVKVPMFVSEPYGQVFVKLPNWAKTILESNTPCT